jgi:hypothetical protein
MPTAFVLRYQEACEAESDDGVCSGMMLGTMVQTKQPDRDRRQVEHTAISRVSSPAATKTGTAVQTEQSDTNHKSSCYGIPRTRFEMRPRLSRK